MDSALSIMKFWPVAVCMVAGLIWLVRLESKVMYLEKGLVKHEDRYKDESSKIFTKLNELEIILANISGKLEYLTKPEE